MNVFQSNRKGIFVDDCSRYLASRLFGIFKGKSVGEIWLNDDVDGSDNVSGSDDDVVSVEISFASFLSLVRLVYMNALSNMVVVLWDWGVKGIFTYLFRCWC